MFDTQKFAGSSLQTPGLNGALSVDRLVSAINRSRFSPDLDLPRSVIQTGKDQTLRGSADSDLLSGEGVTLFGLAGDDVLINRKGKGQLNGGTGKNLLIGGNDGSTLIDDDGGDLLFGGTQADQFWLAAWNAPETPSTIANFQPEIDKIKIRRLDTAFEHVTFQDDEQGVTVFDRDHAIAKLLGVKAAHLNADSFLLGSPDLAKQLQTELETAIQQTNTPGATNAIVTPDGFTWKGAAGLSDLASNTPMQSDDVFNIASQTKPFTAAAVLRVTEQGKISLDDTLGQWLPDIAKNIPDGQNITLRQLLNGTGGIPNFDETAKYQSDLLNNEIGVLSPEQVVEYIYGEPRFTGSRSSSTWTYTNTADILASLMVEKATGLPFFTVLRQEVLEPLGLDSTFFAGKEDLPQNTVKAYRDINSDGVLDDISSANTTIISNYGAGGALFSTAEDVTRFTQALFGGELLNSESIKELTTFVETGFSSFPRYGLSVLSATPQEGVPDQWFLAGDSLGTKAETLYLSDRGQATFTTLANRQALFDSTPQSTTAPVLTSNVRTFADQIVRATA
jgi:D-alanyl-D-alanine carboxypeptidase